MGGGEIVQHPTHARSDGERPVKLSLGPALPKPAMPLPSPETEPAKGLPRSGPMAPPRPRSSLWALLAICWVLPLAVLAMAGWRTWQFEVTKAEERATATLRIVEEHVRKVLSTQVLVLDWLRDREEGLSWEEIEHSRSFYDLLVLLERDYEEIDGIYLADATGHVRINSKQFPLERTLDLSDRDYFRALAAGGTPLAISDAYAGRWNGALSFRVARPLRTPDGVFSGMVAVSVHLEYFERFFETVAGSGDISVILMRGDGRVLASFPRTAAPAQGEKRGLSGQQPAENVEAPNRFGRLTRVDAVTGYPVMLLYAIPYSAIFDQWSKVFGVYSFVALISACVLSGLTFTAIRGEWRERQAIAAWQREQLQRLGAEAETRRMGKYEALGTLAGGVAHHFNNLLPALTGHLEIAMDEAGATSRALPRLRRLLQEVEGARKIIRDILLFSRREITAFRPVNLGVVVAQSVEMFRATIAKGTDLNTEIAPGIYVLGDPGQLAQLVTNLLSNAYDALDRGAGSILLTVRTRSMKCYGAPVGATHAELVCSDTGSGMSAEVLDRAFDPFFTTKPPSSGSGLGLSICDGIIRTHGGRISVESAPGHGATFVVLLPLARLGEA